MQWPIKLGLGLLLMAVLFNSVHFLIFQDPDYIFKFILAQLGFLPISVLLVTVVINQLLQKREKRTRMKKLNMVIGSFFSEVGNELLGFIARLDKDSAKRRRYLVVSQNWTAKDYDLADKKLAGLDGSFAPDRGGWSRLQELFENKKSFMLGLLANPNVLEHENFTELLWAVFHLAEEVAWRDDITNLPASDYSHLTGDMQRAYLQLLSQWLRYMEHLQCDYPYLFSLAMRTNPFDPDARPEVG